MPIRSPHGPTFLAAVAMTLVLAGCSESGSDPARHEYRLAHPLTVQQKTAALIVERGGPAGLVEVDEARVDHFARDFLDRGKGGITVTVPAAAEGDAEARGLAQTIGRALLRRGVPSDDIALELAMGGGGTPGSALLTYQIYTVELPDCSRQGATLVDNWKNSLPSNFGCSVQHNIGAMVVNPRDLIQMQPGTDMDGGRLADVVNKYRRGEDMRSAVKIEATERTSAISR